MLIKEWHDKKKKKIHTQTSLNQSEMLKSKRNNPREIDK